MVDGASLLLILFPIQENNDITRFLLSLCVQIIPYSLNYLVWTQRNIYFVAFLRLLQSLELTIEQRRVHVMSAARI